MLAGLLVVVGVLLAALALSVARTRDALAGRALAVLLLAAAWWGLAGAIELSVTDATTRLRWGDLKYAGIVVVPPAWLLFVLLFTGRRAWVTPRTVLLLALEPALVLVALAVPQAHGLFRYLPASQLGEPLPVVSTGPLFWVHAVYAYVVVLVATVLFVRAMLRAGRAYRGLSLLLLAAAVLPWTANLLFNLAVGPFALVDLTPFLFVLSGAFLVHGLLHGRLTALAGVARDVVVDGLADGVLVVDAFDRVVEANPAARALLGPGRRLLGVPVPQLLPGHPCEEVTVPSDVGPRTVEVRRQPLLDRSGAEAGQVLLLRDITDRRAAEEQVAVLLRERTRVALALQTALRPAALPLVPGVEATALYQPAGGGDEIGGDFYEVFPLGDGRWCAVLGDVAGKGAEAAAVTARVRFTVRALAAGAGQPHRVLHQVNAALMFDGEDDERFCTLVMVVLRPHPHGVTAAVALAGHLPPLLRRADGRVLAVGEPGTALGLVVDPEVVSTTVELTPGDALCLFTDGLVEARDADGEQLGADRVADVLGAVDVAGPAGAGDVLALLDRSARAWHGGELGDDVAVLLLKASLPRSVAAGA